MAALFIARRCLSSSVPRLHLTISVARPAPLSLQMNLSTPELKAAYDKSCGHWSKLSKEEAVMCMYYIHIHSVWVLLAHCGMMG